MSAWPELQIDDFEEGMIDGIDDNILPISAARDCRNFISRYKGILEKRTGQARLNGTVLGGVPHGLYAYYNGAARKLLVVASTKMMTWNPSTLVFDDLKTGLDGTATMICETCANYMVGFNGVDAPFKWSGTGATSALANAPATGRYPVLFKEKLFCVPGTDLSQLWWSDSFAPETWPAVNYWDIKKGDGDVITCLKVLYGDLIITKNRSIHVLRGTSLDDFRLDEMDSRIGCVGPMAAVPLKEKLYLVSEAGLYAFNGLMAKCISDERIPRLWGDIDQANISKSCVTIWDNKVWFSLPLKNQITFKVTAGCTVAGNITIELGGVEQTVALTTSDDLVGEVAAKIAALVFEGWTLGVVTDTVTFTRNELRQPLTLELTAGSTGVTATITNVAQATNNLVLIYDPEGGKFWPMANINANAFQTYNDGTTYQLYTGDSIAGYVNIQDSGTEDFGDPVSAYWVGKGFDNGMPSHLKKAKKAFIEDYPDQDTPATLKVSLDYGDFHEWTYKHYDGFEREYRVPAAYKVKWRYLTPRFSHASAGKCEIRGLTMPFKPKKKPKGRDVTA